MLVFFTLTSCVVPAVAPEAELSAELKEGLTLNAGVTMRLHANIKGRPVPRITWAKMNINIKDRQGIVIKSTNTDTTVMVETVNRYDAGKYILSLESTAGMKMYTIVVKVLGQSSVTRTSLLILPYLLGTDNDSYLLYVCRHTRTTGQSDDQGNQQRQFVHLLGHSSDRWRL